MLYTNGCNSTATCIASVCVACKYINEDAVFTNDEDFIVFFHGVILALTAPCVIELRTAVHACGFILDYEECVMTTVIHHGVPARHAYRFNLHIVHKAPERHKAKCVVAGLL